MKSHPVLAILLACAALAPALAVAQDANQQGPQFAPVPMPIVYHNTQYGFCFLLPADWKGYKIVMGKWGGSTGTGKTMQGPLILLRNPAWTEADPWQDIPIMIFTRAQWREKEKDGLVVSAGGADFDAMGRNAEYVFAQPPRWIGYTDEEGQDEIRALMTQNPFQAPCEPVIYRNTQYGFCFQLPSDWKGFKVVLEKWGGTPFGDTKGPPLEGSELLLRDPRWTKDDPYQDIPIMVFTRAQWELAENNDYAFSAAPVGPSELGRNNRYVFLLPPRWIDFLEVKGVGEVLGLMSQNPFQSPCGHKSTQPVTNLP